MPSDHQNSDPRKQIDELILAGEADRAALCLGDLWRKESGVATAAFAVSRFERLRDKLRLLPYRLAILRSFTVEPCIPLLRASAFINGIDLSIHMGDFNAYAQEILDKDSALYRSAPDAVVLAVRTADVAPDLWGEYADLLPAAVEVASQRVGSSFEQWIRAFRERTRSALIVHTLEQPCRPNIGLLDDQSESSQSETIQRINLRIRDVARDCGGVHVLNYDGLIARHGRLRWQNESNWVTTRMPIAADHLIHLAQEWVRFLIALTGKSAKALVVDLDNTLWGGVIGEDGMAGIKLGTEHPGAAYQSLQRAILDLARRGVLLAICSKNNLDDAMEALENHPGMLLRPKHFAVMRINWNDKAENLREIASELNIGIDALAFLDDNPAERENVRTAIPEVSVIDLPRDPQNYAAALRDYPRFERLALSAEDKHRTSYYAAERERSGVEQSFRSKEDFFLFLEQEAEIAPVSPATQTRISQLTQKTNQFNLTTKRYQEQEIADMARRPGWQVLSIRVRDRFGDHGLVGVAITHDDEEQCEIDTFLLSCRVIGRTVETALLSAVAQGAAARGCKRLTGWFLPTKKNAPAREFYSQHGFVLRRADGEASLWAVDMTEYQAECPKWIKLVAITGEKN